MSPWLLALVVFATTFVLRFASATDISNDHYSAPEAVQILHGEAPFRDFDDPGNFLQLYFSAAFQVIFGHTLLGEIVLCVLSIAVGSALAFLLSTRASGSVAIGLLITYLAVITQPRLYGHPKVFLPALALLVFWRYADRPSPANLILAALTTAFAFLVRHDHGVYVGLAAGALLVAKHAPEGIRPLVRRLALFGGLSAVLLLPFLLFLQMNGGVGDYFRAAIDYGRSETRRQGIFPRPAMELDLSAGWFVIAPPAPAPAPVAVRWRRGIGADQRRQAEQDHGLMQARAAGGATWEYVIVDDTPARAAGLVNDPRVQDTDGIDRATYEITSPRHESIVAAWHRSLPWLRASPAPGVLNPDNAATWLYYTFVSLPPLAILVLALKRLRRRPATGGSANEVPKILSAAMLCAAAQSGLLRDPLSTRLPDAAMTTSILGAWLLAQWLGARGSAAADRPSERTPVSPTRAMGRLAFGAMRLGVAVGLVGLTWAAIDTLARPERAWAESGITAGPWAVVDRLNRHWERLHVSPPIDGWAPPGATGRRGLARYAHVCTKPTDRLLVTRFSPDFLYYSGRAFAGRQIWWFSRYLTTPADQQKIVAKLQTESVPIAILDMRRYDDVLGGFPMVAEYLAQNYDVARDSGFGADDPYRVLTSKQIAPTGTYEPFDLPCYS